MLVQMLVRNSRNLQLSQLAKDFAKFLSNGAVVDDYGTEIDQYQRRFFLEYQVFTPKKTTYLVRRRSLGKAHPIFNRILKILE